MCTPGSLQADSRSALQQVRLPLPVPSPPGLSYAMLIYILSKTAVKSSCIFHSETVQLSKHAHDTYLWTKQLSKHKVAMLFATAHLLLTSEFGREAVAFSGRMHGQELRGKADEDMRAMAR